MTTARTWAARAAGTALLLATIAGGVAAAYVLYVEARVATAIDETAEEVRLVARYRTATVRSPGTIALDDLVVSNPAREFRIELGGLLIRTSPWPSKHRAASVDIPAQRALLQVGDLRWEAQLQGHADLQVLDHSPVLERASIRLSRGRVSSPRLVAPGLSGSIEFSFQASRPALHANGRITLRGPSIGALLAVVGLNAVREAFQPAALAGAFELRADVDGTEHGFRVRRIHGPCGDATTRGALSFTAQGVDGALLLTTPAHAVGVRALHGDWSPELSPPAGWLEQHLAGAPAQS